MNESLNFLINDSQPIAWLTKGIVQFNDFDLSDFTVWGTGFIVKTWNELSLENIILEEYVSEIIDWGTIIDKRYWNKRISFKLFIQGSDNADLLSKINALKQNLHSKNGYLYITRNNIVYRYEATCESIIIPSFSSIDDFIDNIELSFILTSPHSVIEEPIVWNWTKTADFEKIINNLWTYKSYPKVMIIWKSWCAITDTDIELKKVWETTWNNIFIDQAITEWDVLEIDYNAKTINFNQSEIPFTWFLTPLETWLNVFDFTFTGTVNVDVYILYNKVFL